MRRAARRDEVEAEIVEVLRAAGCSVTFLNGRDCPDLLVGIRGQNLLVENKTGKAKLRPGQERFRSTWRGAPVVILRSVDDALALVKM